MMRLNSNSQELLNNIDAYGISDANSKKNILGPFHTTHIYPEYDKHSTLYHKLEIF